MSGFSSTQRKRGPFDVTVTVYDEGADEHRRIKLRAGAITSEWQYERVEPWIGKVAATYPAAVTFELSNILPNGLGDYARAEVGKGKP